MSPSRVRGKRRPAKAPPDGQPPSSAGAIELLRDNGLTITLLAVFSLSLVGTALAGWSHHNRELIDHGAAAIGLSTYLSGGEFLSAVFENWESEFLQMSAFVVLTAFLFQRGSAESRDPDSEPAGRVPVPPKASRLQRLGRHLYAYSLGIALVVLFVLSFVMHLLGSLRAANDEAALHGGEPHGLIAHLGDPQFWFESFQNWQSEFLSTAVLVVLSIVLRFHGSPESKPVEASHAATGK